MTTEYPEFFARFYDIIYHHQRDSVDHEFFLNKVKECNGKILETGAGTGRFLVEALKLDKDIYGIDISDSMIKVMKNKIDHDQYFRISNQNITDFCFDFQFDLIVAPFRVLMHLLEKRDHINALNNVSKHLKPGGRFIFDAFVPDLNQLIKGFDDYPDFEGEYEKGKKVKRFVSTKPDLINQVINISFRLEWDEENSVKSEVWNFPLRFFFRFELEHLIERSDFSKYKIYGDYHGNELNENSKEFVVECIK